MKLLKDPRFLIRFHIAHLIVCGVLIPPAVLWWRESVPFLVFISMWALIVGELAGLQAALAQQEAHTE